MRQILKAARVNKKMTQAQVASALGITPRAYQSIENGVRNGKYSVWDALEDMFSIPQRQLRENTPTAHHKS